MCCSDEEYDEWCEPPEDLELAVEQDNDDEFVAIIRSLRSRLGAEKISTWWDDVWVTMSRSDSVKCAAAVLAGRADGMFDFHSCPLFPTWSPIHEAALVAAPKLCALLLENGFSANTTDTRLDLKEKGSYWSIFNVDSKHMKMEQPLPLDMAFGRIWSLSPITLQKWGKSATKLVIHLCGYDLRRSLQVVEVLAPKSTQLKKQFFNYLKEGKMVEVTALLLVARKWLLSPSKSGGVEDVFGFKSISEMSDYLLSTKSELPLCDAELKELLLLLNIFDKFGSELTAYFHLDRGFERLRPVGLEFNLHTFSLRVLETVSRFIGKDTALEVQVLLEGAGFQVDDPEDLMLVHYRHRYKVTDFNKTLQKNSMTVCSPRSFLIQAPVCKPVRPLDFQFDSSPTGGLPYESMPPGCPAMLNRCNTNKLQRLLLSTLRRGVKLV